VGRFSLGECIIIDMIGLMCSGIAIGIYSLLLRFV
jgi:hypothetical protein